MIGEPDTRNQKAEPNNPEPGKQKPWTRNTELETRSDTRNCKPETRNRTLAPAPIRRKPEILKHEHETTNCRKRPNPEIGNDVCGNTSAKSFPTSDPDPGEEVGHSFPEQL